MMLCHPGMFNRSAPRIAHAQTTNERVVVGLVKKIPAPTRSPHSKTEHANHNHLFCEVKFTKESCDKVLTKTVIESAGPQKKSPLRARVPLPHHVIQAAPRTTGNTIPNNTMLISMKQTFRVRERAEYEYAWITQPRLYQSSHYK